MQTAQNGVYMLRKIVNVIFDMSLTPKNLNCNGTQPVWLYIYCFFESICHKKYIYMLHFNR